MIEVKLANSQAEGTKELNKMRKAVKRFKDALAAAQGEKEKFQDQNEKLQGEIKLAAGSAAEAKAATVEAATKLRATGPSSVQTAEHIRRLEMTIEDLLSREINRGGREWGQGRELSGAARRGTIMAARKMMVNSAVATIKREDDDEEEGDADGGGGFDS